VGVVGVAAAVGVVVVAAAGVVAAVAGVAEAVAEVEAAVRAVYRPAEPGAAAEATAMEAGEEVVEGVETASRIRHQEAMPKISPPTTWCK
jgi:cytochrome c5